VEDREKTLAEIVRRALVEDAARKDVTTRLLVDAARLGDAVIRAKAPGVVSGHEAAREVFSALDASIAYSPMAPDGSPVGSGAAVARVYGHVRAILAGERVALNFLQRLSGIATTTAAFVERVKGTGVVILDTRKTTPGLRVLEKMAVVHGGGQNHRANLAELILVKKNHIAAAGGLASVLKKLGSGRLSQAEIEVTSVAELRMLREGTPKRVMLDNFAPDAVAAAVAEIQSWAERTPEVEVSGGMSLDTVAQYAIPGVNFISVGSLTSQAPVLDMNLTVEGTDKK
jgi:nicotinate-nucleotide pyrophosphorylase (carboxylating)